MEHNDILRQIKGAHYSLITYLMTEWMSNEDLLRV